MWKKSGTLENKTKKRKYKKTKKTKQHKMKSKTGSLGDGRVWAETALPSINVDDDQQNYYHHHLKQQ